MNRTSLELATSRFVSASLPVLLVGAALGPRAAAQFVEVATPLAASAQPCLAPADYDHDGDTDVLVSGVGSHDVPFTTLNRNDNGVFVSSGIAFPGLGRAAAAWGDFDGDGDLDLAMTGIASTGAAALRVLRNDGAVFTSVSGTFTNVFAGDLAWDDFDGDGDLDLLVTGITAPTGSAPVLTRLYRNDAGTFTSVPHPFQDCAVGPIAIADYDGDGDHDVLLCGTAASGGLSAILWRNDNGTYVDAGANLPGMDLGFAQWGDFDGDGDLDLLFGGNTDLGWLSTVFRNDAGVFTQETTSLVPVLWSSAAVGDYDHDGDLDAFVQGYDPNAAVRRSILYRNDAGVFVATSFAFHDVFLGAAHWIDHDGDGDLDLLYAGNDAGADITKLARNDTPFGSVFCSGDGSLATACPCGNAGGAERGCANSVSAAGARLASSGRTSPDTFTLQAASMPAVASIACIFLQGDAVAADGIVFGDGVRCVAGILIRIGSKATPGGAAQYPEVGNASISVRGQVTPGSGVVRAYQAYYRNAAAAFCPPDTFNVTNGLQVAW